MDKVSYCRHRFPPVVIQNAVWLYCRFTLSYRDVEDLLAERGLDVSYETVRRWVLKFGHCEFVSAVPEIIFPRGFSDLLDNRLKYWVSGSKGDAPFNLDFEDREISLPVVRNDDDIVERSAFGGPL